MGTTSRSRATRINASRVSSDFFVFSMYSLLATLSVCNACCSSEEWATSSANCDCTRASCAFVDFSAFVVIASAAIDAKAKINRTIEAIFIALYDLNYPEFPNSWGELFEIIEYVVLSICVGLSS